MIRKLPNVVFTLVIVTMFALILTTVVLEWEKRIGSLDDLPADKIREAVKNATQTSK